jgi:hypothetical protein
MNIICCPFKKPLFFDGSLNKPAFGYQLRAFKKDLIERLSVVKQGCMGTGR